MMRGHKCMWQSVTSRRKHFTVLMCSTYLTNSLQVHWMFDNLVIVRYLLLIDGKVEQWRLHNDKVKVKLWTIQFRVTSINIKFKKHWITLAYIWQRLHFVDDVLEYGSHSNQRISSSPVGQFVGPLSHKRIICVRCLHTFLSLLNLIQTDCVHCPSNSAPLPMWGNHHRQNPVACVSFPTFSSGTWEAGLFFSPCPR